MTITRAVSTGGGISSVTPAQPKAAPLAVGVYRPEDVRRVLGDSREYVEVKVMSELQSASRAVLK